MFLQDIAIGLLIAIIASLLSGFEPSISLIITGLAGSILPDLDMAWYLAKNGWKLDKSSHKHRDVSHYPLITTPVAGFLVWHFYGYAYAIIVATAMLCHYIADSFSIGWGIRWLYPFSERYFCYRKVGADIARFFTWTHQEQDHVASLFGDPDWAKNERQWKEDALVLVVAITITVIWYAKTQ